MRSLPDELHINEATVKTHINQLLSRLRPCDRVQSVTDLRARPRCAASGSTVIRSARTCRAERPHAKVHLIRDSGPNVPAAQVVVAYPARRVAAIMAAPDHPWTVGLDGDGRQLLATVG